MLLALLPRLVSGWRPHPAGAGRPGGGPGGTGQSGSAYSALGDCGEQVEQPGVLGLLQPSLELVLHDGDELLVAESAVAVLVEDGEEDVNDVVGEVHPGRHHGHVLQRVLVDGGAGQVVEVERLLHVLQVHQQVEDLHVVVEGDAGERLSGQQDQGIKKTSSSPTLTTSPLTHLFLRVLVPSLHPLEDGAPLLGRVVRVGEEELRELPLRDPAGLRVRVLASELQPEDLALQAVLEVQEALDRQLAGQILT